MKIDRGAVARFHYTLLDADTGGTLESSRDGVPMAYLHGWGNIIRGLEDALLGREPGESFSITLEPEAAYGRRIEDALVRVPIKRLQGARRWRVGMVAAVDTERGVRQGRIEKLGRFNADLDFNHPMAGRRLTFEVEVLDVREASEEERRHGHAHEEGAHHHHHG